MGKNTSQIKLSEEEAVKVIIEQYFDELSFDNQ